MVNKIQKERTKKAIKKTTQTTKVVKRKGNRGMEKDPEKKIRKAERIQDVLLGLRQGLSVSKACLFAGVNNSTYYDWIKWGRQVTDEGHKNYDKEHPLYKFEERAMKAKARLEQVAKKNIHNSLLIESKNIVEKEQSDIPTTKWYAERKLKDEFSKRIETTGAGGKDLIPAEKRKAIKERLKDLL